MLDTQLAQTIVDRTMSVLHINVNVMDENGIVIAAGDKGRIGNFHSAAARVVHSGIKKVVSAKEALALEGVEPGITLPIQYKNQIIGALGITGAPDIVEKYGELVTLSAVLMIEQAEMKERAFLEQRTRDNILLDLFTGRASENEIIFQRRAEILNFDFSGAWAVMAVRVLPEQPTISEFDYQRIKDRFEARLSAAATQNLYGCFAKDTLALLSRIDKAADRAEQLRRNAETVYGLLSSDETDIRLCIGDICEDWRGIPSAFKFAESALRFSGLYGQTKKTFYAEQYRSEHMLSQLPKEQRQQFCCAVLGPLQGRHEQGRVWLLTLQAYYRNDMNVQQTADELFIHRNTLNMRLGRIAELIGYVPQRFNDAFTLKLALALLQMEPTLLEI